MLLAIIANEELKEEFLSAGISDECKIEWISSVDDLPSDTDAVIDLLFEQNGYDISVLKKNLPKPVIVNSVNKTINEIGFPCCRINGWPGFLKRTIVEASGNNENNNKEIENIFFVLNKKVEWVPDIKGFISARVVSMIINEAYFALNENVSTKEEIDIAMKLGTNYPYGPFEWAKKIGLKNIAGLLTELSKAEKRYEPAGVLIRESNES